MSDLISKAELFNRLASVWTIEDVYSTITFRCYVPFVVYQQEIGGYVNGNLR